MKEKPKPYLDIFVQDIGFGHKIYFIGLDNSIVDTKIHQPWFTVYSAKRLPEPNLKEIEGGIPLIYDPSLFLYMPRPELKVYKGIASNRGKVPETVSSLISKYNVKAGLYNIKYEARVALDFSRTHYLLGVPAPLVFLPNDKMVALMEKLIDRISDLKVMAVDIEVYSTSGGFPKQGDPILTITYTVFRLKDNIFSKDWPEKNVKILSIPRNVKDRTEMEIESRKLVEKFFEVVKQEKPNIIVTFNGTGFDFPYMKPFITRNYYLIERNVIGIWRPEKDERILIPHIDLMLVREYLGSSMGIRSHAAYALDDVALEVAEQLKKFYDIGWLFNSDYIKAERLLNHAKLKDYWEKDEPLFHYYIVADVYLTALIARVWLYSLFMLSALTGMPPTLVQSLNTGQIAEYLAVELLARLGFYPELRKRNLEYSRTTETVDTVEEKVGWVFNRGKVYVSDYGIFGGNGKKIIELDFAQLYPSDMVANATDPTIFFIKGGIIDGRPVDPTLNIPERYKATKKETTIILGTRLKKSASTIKVKYVLRVVPGYGPIAWLVYKLYTARKETKKLKKKAKLLKRIELLAPDQAIKILNNCYPPDTYVLTPNGIKKINELKVGDKVLSVNPETLEVEIDEVVATWEYDYDDYLYVLRNKRYLDLKATPEQHMLVKPFWLKKSKGVFKTVKELFEKTGYIIPVPKPMRYGDMEYVNLLPTAKKLMKQLGHEYDVIIKSREGTHLRRFLNRLPERLRKIIVEHGEYDHNRRAYRISVRNIDDNDVVELYRFGAEVKIVRRTNNASAVDAVFPVVPFLEFVGWYLSDGSIYEEKPKMYEDAKRGWTKSVIIYQKKYVDKVKSSIERLGLNYSTYVNKNNDVTIFVISNEVFATFIEDNFGVKEKRIPDWVIERAPLEAREALFRTMMLGDGDAERNRYTTSSETLRDTFMALLVTLGYFCKWKKEGNVYRITFGRHNVYLDKAEKRLERYKGKVYDVTTKKNHTIIAGRNGKFVVTGQSFYGAFSKSRGNLINEVISATVFWRTQKLLYEVIDFINNELPKRLGKEVKVLYGDTDSAYILTDGDVDEKTLMEEVNKWIQERYGPFYQMELEDVYDTMLIPKQKGRNSPSAKSYICLKNGKPVKVKGEFYKLVAPLAIKERLLDFYVEVIRRKPRNKKELKQIVKMFLEREPMHKWFIKKSISSFVNEDDTKKLKKLNREFHYAALYALTLYKSPGVVELDSNINTLVPYMSNKGGWRTIRVRIDPREVERTQRAVIVHYLPHPSRDPKKFMVYVGDDGKNAVVHVVTLKHLEVEKEGTDEKSAVEKYYVATFAYRVMKLPKPILLDKVLDTLDKYVITPVYKKLIPALIKKEVLTNDWRAH